MKANRKVIGLGLVGVCALLGIGALVASSGGDGGASTAEAEKAAKARTTQVLVVSAESVPLATGADSPVLKNAVAVKTLSSDQVPSDAIHSLEELATLNGQRLNAALVKGDKLTLSKFQQSPSFANSSNPVEVPKDLLQISFSLEPQRVMGGRLRAGDRVGVLASFAAAGGEGKGPAETNQVSHLILAKVMVANVQIEALPANPEAASAPDPNALGLATTSNLTVTLALDVAQAEKLAFALEFGKVWLATMPGDAKTDNSRIQIRDSVLGVGPGIPEVPQP